MKSKNIKLYNLIFPMYMARLMPPWIMLFGLMNYIIDRYVLTKTIRKSITDFPKEKISHYIWKVWGFGYLADIIGAVFLFNLRDFINSLGTVNSMYFITGNIDYNPLANIYSFSAVMTGVVLTAVLIYLFNRYIVFRTLDIDVKVKVKTALALAVFTAPYSFLIPTPF